MPVSGAGFCVHYGFYEVVTVGCFSLRICKEFYKAPENSAKVGTYGGLSGEILFDCF